MYATPAGPARHCTDQPLSDQLRDTLGGRTARATSGPAGVETDDTVGIDRVDRALDALDALLDLGWITPGRIEDLLAADPVPDPLAQQLVHGDGVRSLAEDLAVVRVRAATATERSRDVVARARQVHARSLELADVARRRMDDARRSQEGSRARAEALESEVGHLRAALESRPRIEHAVGMVMLALGCDADTAWKALSRVSQHTNRKLRDVADALCHQVAEGHGVPDEVATALRTVFAGGTLRSQREETARQR